MKRVKVNEYQVALVFKNGAYQRMLLGGKYWFWKNEDVYLYDITKPFIAPVELNILLKDAHLTWVIKDEVLQVTTEKNARGKLVQKTYPVADLIIPVDNHIISPVASFPNALGQSAPGLQQNGTFL